MRKFSRILLLFLFVQGVAYAQGHKVTVIKENDSYKLNVDGKDVFVNGMNWDYFPIGTNFNYSLWNQSGDVIKAALDNEMSLLKNMGVNVIRQYTGVPAKWIEYIYKNYGIYTMLNHSFGRYGLNVKGKWEANTDYSNPNVKELLLKEVTQMVQSYANTPGIIFFLLGNENNYGLFWKGAETEDIPMESRESTIAAGHMYKLFNEAAVAMKKVSNTHPISICNGDLLFLDIINRECKDVDILGINVYRGLSFGDMFTKVRDGYGKPIVLTEFGSDAYNVLTNQEDQYHQAIYNVANWKEIYENAAGFGKANNSLGGFTFQFSDGWWKTGQTKELDVHNTEASWSNGGYLFDYKAGQNNMNEEWFGICAKGPNNERGVYELFPRASYYALKDVHQFNPYAPNGRTVDAYFNTINIGDAVLKARGDKASLEVAQKSKIYLSDIRMDFTTFSTGGSLISTPKAGEPPLADPNSFPRFLGFDNMQSVFLGVTAKPAPNVTANVQFNVLGNVAENPIDEIFYENRGRNLTVLTPNGQTEITDINRIQLYRSTINWNNKHFNLTGFYRTNHYHWAYEGDMFNLYQEANYGPNIDIYNGQAPFGFEIEAKGPLKGLKAAFGPELWWGANPAILLKYSRKVAKFDVTGIFHEDLVQRTGLESSIAIPMPKTRRMALSASRKWGNFGMDIGGLWAGQPLVGRDIQVVRDGNVFQSEIKPEDNWGGKVKFTYSSGMLNWYGLASYMGLVANGGFDQTRTFTGWRLKDVGMGNMYNVLSGFTVRKGNFEIAPNFLYQKPLEGPVPAGLAAPSRPRNILDDPFSVRQNRETVGAELLLTYDPTPGTWMYEWDNDRSEDSKFAMSLDFVYRHLPTIMDAGIGIQGNGRSFFPFPASVQAQDLWEVNGKVVNKLTPDFGIITNILFGNGQANGDDQRVINRFGIDVKTIYKSMRFLTIARFNDWGPFDYHRDFNFTFPVQLMADISTGIGKADWFILPSSRIGIRGTYRTLDQYSNRYAPMKVPDGNGNMIPLPNPIGFPNGNEWEIRTYLSIGIGN